MNIGEKIKQLRTQKMMTQSDLAGDFITRNMLSKIEHGQATPSVQSLIYLSERLGVPAGYFLADEKEEMLYKKAAAMPDILSALSSEDWEIGYDLCEKLDIKDNEIGYLKAVFAFNLGKEAFFEGEISQALHILDQTYGNCGETTAYPISWLKNMIAVYLFGICDISSTFDASSSLPDKPPVTDGTDAFCNFYGTYRKIISENRYPERLPDGDDAYSRLIRGAYFYKRGDRPRAYTELRAITQSNEQVPTPVVYYVFRDLENCCRDMSDFKGAYEYSGLKNSLLERFITQQITDNIESGEYGSLTDI